MQEIDGLLSNFDSKDGGLTGDGFREVSQLGMEWVLCCLTPFRFRN